MMVTLVKTAAVFALTTLAATAASVSQDPRNFLVVFGDSWSRTNFDPAGSAPGPQNPIGNPAFPGATSSGGPNWVGYLATEFNNSFAYAKNTQTVAYNLARGGSTVRTDLVYATGRDFKGQVDLFTQYYRNGPKNRGWVTANAVVVVWYGVNEIRKTYGNDTATADQLFSLLIDAYYDQATRLYDLGLRKFMLLEAVPMNLLPDFQKLDDQRAAKLDSAVKTWNSLLRERLSGFQQKYKDAVAVTVDASEPLWTGSRNPSAFGAPNASCKNPNGVSCLWTDGFHPGIKLMRAMAAEVAKVPQMSAFKCFPGACGKSKRD